MNLEKLIEAIALLREEKSDNQYYEAKAAEKGIPGDVKNTISAFANTPGGGVLILGLDENRGFDIVGVYDAKQCQQTLANYARKEFSSLVSIKTFVIEAEGKKVVWANVEEADKTLKPVKIKSGGKSFIRLYDGDFHLSEQEEQLFIAGRGPSLFDEDVISGSIALQDLDEKLTAKYIEIRKKHLPALVNMDDKDVLFRTGVTSRDGELTRAGAIALGIFPQQFMPSYSIKASVQKKSGYTPDVRAVNVASISGPISMMIDECVMWVARNSDEYTVNKPDGHVYRISEYPSDAVRELISNALIHRDLNPMSMFQTISLTIYDDCMTISNPGGLYGISVRELGQTRSMARNAKLLEMCQYITNESGRNVVERLGTGIPKVLQELRAADMEPPVFIDAGIYFTVIVKSAASNFKIKTDSPGSGPSGNNEKISAALSKGAMSKQEIANETTLTLSQIRYALDKMLREERILKLGEGSSPLTKYALPGRKK